MQSSDVYGYDAAIAPGDLDRLVLGTAVDGVFASQDGGRTWTNAALGVPVTG